MENRNKEILNDLSKELNDALTAKSYLTLPEFWEIANKYLDTGVDPICLDERKGFYANAEQTKSSFIDFSLKEETEYDGY